MIALRVLAGLGAVFVLVAVSVGVWWKLSPAQRAEFGDGLRVAGVALGSCAVVFLVGFLTYFAITGSVS